MKKLYEELELEIIRFESEDVICASVVDKAPDETGGFILPG